MADVPYKSSGPTGVGMHPAFRRIATMRQTRMRDAAIKATIRQAYAVAGVAEPTVASPIAPLARLIDSDGFSLTGVEVASLTPSAAEKDLIQRGALIQQRGWDDIVRLAGYIYSCGGMAVLYVNSGDEVERRRFSAAHELGHFLLHFLPRAERGEVESEFIDGVHRGFDDASDPDEANGPEPAGEDAFEAVMEAEANRFAAELLMPSQVVTELAASLVGRFHPDDLSWWLSGEMLVSQQAMRYRLQSLGLAGDLRVATRKESVR
jgi:hypothetical protein